MQAYSQEHLLQRVEELEEKEKMQNELISQLKAQN